MTNSKSQGHVMASQLNCLKNLYMKFNLEMQTKKY